MSQALYRKWRPQTWDAVVGQQHVIQTLRNALLAGRVGHAYLFAGPRGTGKTTTARLLAKAVNCLEPDLALRPCGQCLHCQAVNQGRFLDLIEIDAASNTSVEDVRDLREKINFSPNQGKYKVYIVDEVHMLSTAAFNALLKTLEEPPAHAIFILATTEAYKIPPTVLSRCQRHEFRRISVTEIVSFLEQLAQQEGIRIERDALNMVARQATGSMRDAISLLDQLASSGEIITLEMAQMVLGTATSQAVLDLINALVERQPAAGLDHIHQALDAGSDPRQFARQIVDYLRHLLLVRLGNPQQIDATVEMRSQMARHAQAFDTPELLRVIQAFNFAANEARAAWQPSLPLEMAFVESLESPAVAEKATPVSPPVPGKSQPENTTAASPTRQTPPAGIVPNPTSKAGSPGSAAAEQPSPQDLQATQTLSQSWDQLLAAVRQRSPSAYGALNSSKSRYIRDATLLLFYASDVVKEKMEKPENLEIVQQALNQVFGQEFRVKCIVDTTKRDAIPANVDNDGMVAAALRDLGGEIVDIHQM